jgi:hypothetical protein
MRILAIEDRDGPCQEKKSHMVENVQVAPANDHVFDQWLTHHLGRLYDPVAEEAIPESLLRLLEQKLK